MLRTHVDDINWAQYGRTPSVQRDVKKGAVILANGLMASKCKISEKSEALQQTKRLRNSVSRYLKAFGLVVQPVAQAWGLVQQLGLRESRLF